jgi:hypothetical protein
MVDAAAKTDSAAGNVLIVAGFPVPRVAACCTQKHQHLLTLVDCDITEFHRACGSTEEGA